MKKDCRQIGSEVLLPERLLDLSIVEGAAIPNYLTPADHLWIELLLEELQACAGLTRNETEIRLTLPQRATRSFQAFKAMRHILLQHCQFEVVSQVSPRQLRRLVFTEAAASRSQSPERAIERASAEAGISCAELKQALYADIPSERRLRLPDNLLSPTEMIERYNLRLAQGILKRTHHLEVCVRDSVKAVLRAARLNGLLCHAESEATHDGTSLELSGPLSILRHTTKYGHQMAKWLPVLMGTSGWSLTARCTIRGQSVIWHASHNDRLGSSHAPPRRFDSKLEQRFFRDLRRLAPSWQVLREAEPLQLGRRIVCADFTLLPPEHNTRIPVEIVGFWTPEYLRQKIETIEQMPTNMHWVFCVEESLDPSALQALREALAKTASASLVFPFRRHIDVPAFLNFLPSKWLQTKHLFIRPPKR
jgi:uncharacterized protein